MAVPCRRGRSGRSQYRPATTAGNTPTHAFSHPSTSHSFFFFFFFLGLIDLWPRALIRTEKTSVAHKPRFQNGGIDGVPVVGTAWATRELGLGP